MSAWETVVLFAMLLAASFWLVVVVACGVSLAGWWKDRDGRVR